MWIVRSVKKETRYQVPSLRSHMISSHDMFWLWYEETHIPPSDRFSFWIRLIKFAVIQLILFGVVAYFFSTRPVYFFDECQKRSECYQACSEDFFPDLRCTNPDDISFKYNGNTYDNLFRYDFSNSDEFADCHGYLSENEDYEDSRHNSNRQERLHTCFNACQSDDQEGFSKDERPKWVAGAQTSLLCVHPDDDCEEPYTRFEVETGDMGVAPIIALISIAIANILQYFYEFLLIWTVSIKNDNINNLRQQNKKCFMQTMVVLATMFIALIAGWQMHRVTTFGADNVYAATVFMAFVIDQCKSFLLQLGIWYFFLRRCGYLLENEKDFIDPEWASIRKDTTVARLRNTCGKYLETRVYEVGSFTLLIIYAVFVLFVLSFSDLFSEEEVELFDLIDLGFLAVFMLELCCQTFVHMLKYYKDAFNTCDAAIITVSFILFFAGVAARGLAVLRLLRLLRLIIVLRKASSNNRKRKKEFATVLEESLDILRQIAALKKLNKTQRRELNWVLSTIIDNTLYEVNLQSSADSGSGQNTFDSPEARRWILMATPEINDVSKWFDRDLEDYIHERKRLVEPGENKDDEQVKDVLDLPERTHIHLDKMVFEDLGRWRFNAFQYAELLEDKLIAHFVIKIFTYYGIVEKFSIPLMCLRDLCNQIQLGYSDKNPYHNALHAVDVTYRVNYFYLTGQLMKHLSDLDFFALIMASILHDFQHPGVNNRFLVTMKHKKAIMYNDKSVLEMHHIASAYEKLLDTNNDIFIEMSEDQYWVIRVMIINMILATDITKHEEVLGAFSNRYQKEKFPSDDDEKQILLNMTLRVAVLGNPMQPPDLYFKWMNRFMEELYQQGDIEKHRQFPELSNGFMDRTTTNPYSSQLGYIQVLVEPLANVWVQYLPELKEDLIIKGLNENKELLQQKEQESADQVYRRHVEDQQLLDRSASNKRRDGLMS